MRGHVSPEKLADWREGLLPEGEAAQVREHVAACARCAADEAGLAEVTALLGALPAPVMPAEFADRVEAAIRAERSPQAAPAPAGDGAGRPGPRSARDRWRHRPAALRAAAAAAAVVVLGAGVYALSQTVGGGRSEPAAGSASAPGAAPAGAVAGPARGAASRPAATPALGHGVPPVVATGADFVPGRLRSQVAAVVSHPGKGAATPATGAQLSRVGGRAQVRACARHVAAVGGGKPILVDVASFRGDPATVVVLQTSTARRVWLVGHGCSASHTDLLWPTFTLGGG